MSSLSHSNDARQQNGRRNWLIAALVAVLVIAAAVAAVVLSNRNTPTVQQPGSGTPPTTLQEAQAVWQDLGAEGYAYTIQLSCFCIDEVRQPVRIVVRNGQLESMTVVETGAPANPEFFDRYASAANLFSLLSDAEAQNADRIDATYDAQTGLPTQVYVDYSEQMADEELSFSVSNIELLP